MQNVQQRRPGPQTARKNTGQSAGGLNAVDFFCSGGGMTCGLRQAGIKVLAGIDHDPACKETYEFNNPGSRFLLADIFDLKPRTLEKSLGLRKNDSNLIMIGCSPCQFWSVIQTDKTKSKKSRNLLLEFARFVDYFNPGYVLVENVPGILGRKEKSGLAKFVANLERKKYRLHYGSVNMSDYGVPQSRRRFSLLATRLHKDPIFPVPDTNKVRVVADVLGSAGSFREIGPGHNDPTAFNHSTAQITDRNLLRLRKTSKNGGSWLDWSSDEHLKRLRYRGRGFVDNYGRMRWDRPAPTITTKFISISNGRFGHPEEDRALSIREGATLQTFPKTYVFIPRYMKTSARMIGNAVPPLFARHLGEAIVKAHPSRGR